MNIFALAVLIAFAPAASAEVAETPIFSRIAYENYLPHQVVTDDGVGLNFIELLGEDGQPSSGRPILLMHGFTSNLNYWKHAAEEYRRLGLRVFIANWRGHGQGRSRSVVTGESFNGHDSRYEYDNMAIYDVPTLVKAIYARTGRKIIYQGHSMGGMMAHLAFAGLARNRKGEIAVSVAKARRLEGMVDAFIPVGSPLDLGETNALAEVYLKLVGIKLDHSNRISEYSLTLSLLEQIRLRATYKLLRSTSKLDGTMNLKNMTFDEFAFNSKFAGSDVPSALIDSLGKMGKSIYGANDGKINYSDLSFRVAGHPTSIPTLIVSAELDSLAPLADQTQLAQLNNLPHVIFKNTGHIDILSAESHAKGVVKRTLEFVDTLPLCEELLAQ